MWQRIQMALSIVLLAAVALLAAQLYSGQRANEVALADITSTLKQLTQSPATGDAPAAGQSSSQRCAQQLERGAANRRRNHSEKW